MRGRFVFPQLLPFVLVMKTPEGAGGKLRFQAFGEAKRHIRCVAVYRYIAALLYINCNFPSSIFGKNFRRAISHVYKINLPIFLISAISPHFPKTRKWGDIVRGLFIYFHFEPAEEFGEGKPHKIGINAMKYRILRLRTCGACSE